MVVSLTYAEWQEQVFFDWKPKVRFKVVPKGRRVGGTKGAANACIDYLLQGESPILWGDTINSNIDRYFERYFFPELKENEVPFEYSKVDKQLKINGGVIDFRSADRPENWEGFGYKLIILNEAGIILKNPYLYTNAVLPMLMDFKDSKLIAIGTPKGKYLKNGQKHPYYQLYENAMKGVEGYESRTITSYNSPFLTKEIVKLLEEEIAAMSPKMVQQEIYGEFIDGVAGEVFAYNFDEEKHLFDNIDWEQGKTPFIAIDFNLNPFICMVGQFKVGHKFEVDFLYEIVIENGTMEKMIERLKDFKHKLPLIRLTGDSMGKKRELAEKDNASYYIQLMRGLGLHERQLVVPANPTHENSRADFNYALANGVFRVHSRCKTFVRDLKYVEVDNEGKILKKDRKQSNQQADALDCGRYAINTFAKQWIYRR